VIGPVSVALALKLTRVSLASPAYQSIESRASLSISEVLVRPLYGPNDVVFDPLCGVGLGNRLSAGPGKPYGEKPLRGLP
jgi:hypothetical protein